MTIRIISILFLGVFHSLLIAQTDSNCEGIKNYFIPEKLDKKSKTGLERKISELSSCGYDSIEIKLLQNNSFFASLVNEALNKQLNSDIIQDFTLNAVLKEFEILRSDAIFQLHKEEFLHKCIEYQNTMERQKNRILSNVYPTSKARYEPIKKSEQSSPTKSILYFTHEGCINCRKFEDVVLKNEYIAQLINEKFQMYMLETDYSVKDPKAIEKINYDLQVKVFNKNFLPLHGILDNEGKVIGTFPYGLDAETIYIELKKLE